MFLGRRSSVPLAVIVPIFASLSSCKYPSIHSSLLHPDADKVITFDAGRGSLTGPIAQMDVEVGGAVMASAPGASASYTGGPYAPFSNSKLYFRAIAHQGSKIRRRTNWIYVANPKGNYTYTPPTGSNDGYPDATSEQTGANLYRLDKPAPHLHALFAVMEYANDQGVPLSQILATADNLAAAVAWYVNEHMSWRDDGTNKTVFDANGWSSYDPGWDYPQPADLTLTISGDLTNAAANDDFQGDCEDHAILRAALLRALGFAPWAIWDAIDEAVSHEYNVVLYEGAYRLMDYGTIDRWLDTHTWDAHKSKYGWNEDHGPRGVNSTTNGYLMNNTDNYPGGKDDGNPWSYQIYYRDTSP